MTRSGLALWLLPLFFAANSYAHLGGREASINLDRQAVRGALARMQTRVAAGIYRVHEITTSSNSVREYVNPQGMVFAVTWNGLSRPDLSQLFGSYYAEYAKANARTPRPPGRAPKRVVSANLVSMRFGHMRDVRGKAFLPALVPPGVNIDSLP